jgi:hypothetical protein
VITSTYLKFGAVCDIHDVKTIFDL